MILKEDWWCIKEQCKHYNQHTVHKGKATSNEYCKHNAAVKCKHCKTPNLGLELASMEMCPILYDMYLED
jgi:hypothetical protein